MNGAFDRITCDGCGAPASPNHIAERLGRLERATRFRPVHIQVLFLALTPFGPVEDDFYGPPRSKAFFESMMAAVGISSLKEKDSLEAQGDPGVAESDVACLIEFQRRGYFLAYLSECPVPEDVNSVATIGERLGPTPALRIRFNYRPKRVALLGKNTAPLIEILEKAGLGSALLLDQGEPLTIPEVGDPAAIARFREVLASATTTDNLDSEYDSIRVKHA
jgi:hypothetical protein